VTWVCTWFVLLRRRARTLAESGPTIRWVGLTAFDFLHVLGGRGVKGFLTRVAGQGDDLAEEFKAHLEKSMTLDELAEAQRLAREWKAKGGQAEGVFPPMSD